MKLVVIIYSVSENKPNTRNVWKLAFYDCQLSASHEAYMKKRNVSREILWKPEKWRNTLNVMKILSHKYGCNEIEEEKQYNESNSNTTQSEAFSIK